MNRRQRRRRQGPVAHHARCPRHPEQWLRVALRDRPLVRCTCAWERARDRGTPRPPEPSMLPSRRRARTLTPFLADWMPTELPAGHIARTLLGATHAYQHPRPTT